MERDKIIKAATSYFQVSDEPDTEAMYLLPDGRFLYTDSFFDEDGMEFEYGAHSNIEEWLSFKGLVPEYSLNDGDDSLTLDKLGAIRFNLNDQNYSFVSLSKEKPTSQQYKELLKIFDLVYEMKYPQIQIGDNRKGKTYTTTNRIADDFVNIIKRYYTTNTLTEEVEGQAMDSENNPLTQEQVEFFKDSKIRDEQGNLLVTYHGTKSTNTFDIFKYGDVGFHFGTKEQASIRNANISSFYLNIKNPLIVGQDARIWDGVMIFTLVLMGYSILPFELTDEETAYIKETFKGDVVSPEDLFDKDSHHFVLDNYDYDINDGVTEEEIIDYFMVEYLPEWDVRDAAPYKDPINKYLRDLIIKRGYDGIKYNNQYDNEWEYLDEGDPSYIAFFPSQIKRIDNKTPSSSDSINEKANNSGNTFIFRGKRAWSGSVNAIDGVIEETHTYKQAVDADFHHSYYFSSAQLEKMEEGECVFFFVDEDGNIEIDPTNRGEDVDEVYLMDSIKEQIKISAPLQEENKNNEDLSTLSTKELLQHIKDKFGNTEGRAKYLLDDGTTIAFNNKQSKEYGYGTSEHDDIVKYLNDRGVNDVTVKGRNNTSKFLLDNANAIRMFSDDGFDLPEREPTKQQYKYIESICDVLNLVHINTREDELVDYDLTYHSPKYVINRIKRYYNTGELLEELSDADYGIYYRGHSGNYGATESSNSYIWLTDNEEYAQEYADQYTNGKVTKLKLLTDNLTTPYALPEDYDEYEPGDAAMEEYIYGEGYDGYEFESGNEYIVCVRKDKVKVIDDIEEQEGVDKLDINSYNISKGDSNMTHTNKNKQVIIEQHTLETQKDINALIDLIYDNYAELMVELAK